MRCTLHLDPSTADPLHETAPTLNFLRTLQCQGGLSYDIVRECAYGEEGKKLSLAAARETEGLVPPHKYSPWVTMNGR